MPHFSPPLSVQRPRFWIEIGFSLTQVSMLALSLCSISNYLRTISSVKKRLSGHISRHSASSTTQLSWSCFWSVVKRLSLRNSMSKTGDSPTVFFRCALTSKFQKRKNDQPDHYDMQKNSVWWESLHLAVHMLGRECYHCVVQDLRIEPTGVWLVLTSQMSYGGYAYGLPRLLNGCKAELWQAETSLCQPVLQMDR